MSLQIPETVNPAKSLTPRPLPKAGVQPARIAQIIDLGVQARFPYQGKEKPPVPQVFVNLELVTDEFEVDGEKIKHRLGLRPLTIISRASQHFEKSSISAFLKAVDPTNKLNGSLDKLGDTPVLATVVHVAGVGKHSGRTFANITAIMQPPENYPVPQLSSPPVVFSFDNPTREAWDLIPVFLQEKIKTALNYKGSKVEALVLKIMETKNESS